MKLYEPTVDAGSTVSESVEQRGIRHCSRYVCLTGPGSSPSISTRNTSPCVCLSRSAKIFLSRQATLFKSKYGFLEEGCVCMDLVTRHKKRYTCAHYTPVLRENFFAYLVVY